MEGKKRGDQARVKNVYRRAHYTHCHCYHMLLVLRKLVNKMQKILNFFENVKKMSSLFIKSVESKRIKKCLGGSLPIG